MKKLLSLLLLLTFCLTAFCSCSNGSDGGSTSLIGCWMNESGTTAIQFFSNGTLIEMSRERHNQTWGESWHASEETTWHAEADGTLVIGGTVFHYEFITSKKLKIFKGDGDDFSVTYTRTNYNLSDLKSD